MRCCVCRGQFSNFFHHIAIDDIIVQLGTDHRYSLYMCSESCKDHAFDIIRNNAPSATLGPKVRQLLNNQGDCNHQQPQSTVEDPFDDRL